MQMPVGLLLQEKRPSVSPHKKNPTINPVCLYTSGLSVWEDLLGPSPRDGNELGLVPSARLG